MSMDYTPSSSGNIGSGALTRTLLQNYTLRIKNLEDEFSMEEVPAEIRNFFVPYVRHMQAIDNIAYCLNNLFRANEPILNAFNSLYYQLNDLTGTFKKNLDELTNNLIDNFAPPFISEPTMQTRSNRKTFDVSHVVNIVKERRCVNNLKNPGRRGRIKSKLNERNTANKGLTLNDGHRKLKWGQVISRTPVCQIRDVILGQKVKNEEKGSTEKAKNCELDLHCVSEEDSVWNEFSVLVPKEEPPSLHEDVFNMQPSVALTNCKNHFIFPEPEKWDSTGMKTNFETLSNYSNANNESTSAQNVISNCVENHPSEDENFAASNKAAFSTENLLFDDENLILVHIVGYANPFCLKLKRSNSIMLTYVAGCGVWFNHNHSLNISAPMRDGAPCSYSAEIEAAILAINQANNIGIKKIKLRTSSKILYKCLTKWIGTYKQNNWSTRIGTPVKNKERLRKLDKLLSAMDVVDLEYVKERKNIAGFQEAFELAKSATSIKEESI